MAMGFGACGILDSWFFKAFERDGPMRHRRLIAAKARKRRAAKKR